jgi:hypothetical protein
MGERIKDNDGGDKFNYDTVKNFWKCHNVPPSTAIIKNKVWIGEKEAMGGVQDRPQNLFIPNM